MSSHARVRAREKPASSATRRRWPMMWRGNGPVKSHPANKAQKRGC